MNQFPKESTLKKIEQTIKASMTAIKNHVPGAGYVKIAEDIQWLTVFDRLLKDCIIVLDDIERKHNDLSISDLFGFLNEFTQEQHCKFILVLDKDKFKDESERELWETYKEKIIDEEVFMQTTPEESYDIASGTLSSEITLPLKEKLKESCVICNILDIRILGKIIQLLNFLVKNRSSYSSTLIEFIPSFVLLTAIHYHSFEKDIQYKTLFQLSPYHSPSGTGLTKVDQEFWTNLLSKLKIYHFGKFEKWLVNFLSGKTFDENEFVEIIKETNITKKQRETSELLYVRS